MSPKSNDPLVDAAAALIAGTKTGADPLIEDARALAQPAPPPRLRAIYHLASTGGTLIARALSTMPNVTLLSELDPLSTLDRTKPHEVPDFRPLDLIWAARNANRPVAPNVLEAAFRAALAEIFKGTTDLGRRLVIRGHPHSQFCTDVDPASRPTLHAILEKVAPVQAVITVRHPLDSLISMRLHRFMHYVSAPEQDTADAYALRYHAFLDAHPGLPVLRYEDFVAAPDASMAWLCDQLSLGFTPGVEALIRDMRLSGSSGRQGNTIAPRERRPVDPELAAEIAQSASWAALLDRLGYAE